MFIELGTCPIIIVSEELEFRRIFMSVAAVPRIFFWYSRSPSKPVCAAVWRKGVRACVRVHGGNVRPDGLMSAHRH